MTAYAALIATLFARIPSQQWVIQTEGETVTIVHKQNSLIVLHFPMRDLKVVASVIRHLDGLMTETCVEREGES
jgi:hypothetical protein